MLKYRVRKDRFYVGATPKGRTFLCEDPKLACSFEDISVAAELASLWSDGFIEAFEDLGSSPEAFDETPNAAPEEILITSCLAGGTVTFTVDRVYKSPNDQHHPVLRVGFEEMNFGEYKSRPRTFNGFFFLSDEDCDSLLAMVRNIRKGTK